MCGAWIWKSRRELYFLSAWGHTWAIHKTYLGLIFLVELFLSPKWSSGWGIWSLVFIYHMPIFVFVLVFLFSVCFWDCKGIVLFFTWEEQGCLVVASYYPSIAWANSQREKCHKQFNFWCSFWSNCLINFLQNQLPQLHDMQTQAHQKFSSVFSMTPQYFTVCFGNVFLISKNTLCCLLDNWPSVDNLFIGSIPHASL